MNQWFDDPRTATGEEKTLAAERAERRGNFGISRTLYHEAGEAFEVVAISVPPTHPNTRSDLAIAAVVTFARAGDFGRAVAFANRMLAEYGALSVHGRAELGRLTQEYAKRMVSAEATPITGTLARLPTLRAGSRSQVIRQAARERARPLQRGVA